MDINNDLQVIITTKNKLIECKTQFGDVNLQMINMIHAASITLEGKQMEIAKEETMKTVKGIRNLISTIESNEKFLDQLYAILEEYLSCKFNEVNI